MNKTWADRYIEWAERLLPSPFVIAVLLTAVTFIWSVLQLPDDALTALGKTADYWERGVWDLLKFSMQMMFMLTLGYTIALSDAAQDFISRLTGLVKTNTSAVLIVLIFSLLMGYLNWGLGLVFGAILARKVGIHASQKNIDINYPLVGAAAYTSLMVWHGGLSGSAPLTVAKVGHNMEAAIGVVPISETLYSPTNTISILLIFLLLPVLAYFLSKKSGNKNIRMPVLVELTKNQKQKAYKGAEVLDYSRLLSVVSGIFVLGIFVYKAWQSGGLGSYINLDSINLLLLSVALLMHKNIRELMDAVASAIKSSAGILVQFPLYAGIMGIMKYGGIIDLVAGGMTDLASVRSFPALAFSSSAFVNVLVPSGGAQWQVQGPILIQAAENLGYSIPKTILALSYGDQVTNMLQPFWALPLLGITGLKAKHILPYSILFMVLGIFIYLFALYAS
jgi:short-chain fatty acids transporter